jgi:two-component system chemotaxis response regulator CheY
VTRAVLIVDDDQFIRRLIATTLEDVADFDLHEAADGLQALELAAQQEPTLVFLDVDMPRLNGIEACRALRQRQQDSPATIVMLTAAHGDEVEREAEQAGADLFLTKPFSPLDLLQLVDRLGGDAN